MVRKACCPRPSLFPLPPVCVPSVIFLGIFLVEEPHVRSTMQDVQQVYQTHCADVVRLRKECWARSLQGIHGEECIREELKEKRCLATHLCPTNAKRFYQNNNGQCSLWAEAFAFGPNDVQRAVSKDRIKMKKCRKIVMDLSKCMSKYTQYNSPPSFVPTYQQ